MDEAFGEMLNRLLGEHDRSQAWLADKIGVHRATVGRWINDPITKPASPEIVKEIGRALNLNEAKTQDLLVVAFPSLRKLKSSISLRSDSDVVLSSLPLPHYTEDTAPLVGRATELAQLQDCLAGVQDGLAHLVLIAGEAGIGKTRLVQEFMAGHVAEVSLSCATKSYEGDQAIPCLALSEALTPLVLAGLTPDIDSIWLAEVAQVVSSLWEIRPELRQNPNIETEYALTRRFQGLTQFITALTGELPLVLWLDDVQWVDEVTFDYLRHLLTRGREAQVLVVGTYRPEEVDADHPLAELTATLIRENLLTEISLSPLTEEEVSRLVADLTGLDSELWPLGRRLYREIGGVPFFITEQVKLLAEEGWLNVSQWETIPLAPRLQGLISRRYKRLDERALQFVKVAAVVGARFRFHIVKLAGQLDEEAALDALDRLLTAGLIRKKGAGDYSFWHDQARTVLYEDLRVQVSTEHWQHQHQRTGEAIEMLYPDGSQREAWLEQLAHYFYETEIWPKALTYLLQAGQKALALFALKSARTHFERAEQLLMQATVEPSLAQQVICAEGLGDAYTHLGLFDLALPRYQQAVGLTETRDTSVARLGWKIARVYERQAKFKLAVQWLERSLIVLDQTSEKDVEARVCCLRGLIEVRRGQPEAALAWAEEALRLSKEVREASLAQEELRAERTAAAAVVEEAQAHNLMGVLYRARGELEKATFHCEHSLRLYKQINNLLKIATVQTNLGVIAFEQDNWPGAVDAYKRALATHEKIGDAYNQALTSCNLADLYCHQGQLEPAMAYGQAGLEGFKTLGAEAGLLVLAHENIGAVYLRQGDLTQARRHLEEGLRLIEAGDVQEFSTEVHNLLAEVYLRVGESQAAEAMARQALAEATEQGTPVDEAIAHRVLAQVFQAQGDTTKAEGALQSSRILLEREGQRYELARTLLALATLYETDVERRPEGEVMLTQAQAIFEQLGAALELAEVKLLSQRIAS